MPADPRQPDSIAAAIAAISESLTRIVQDEVALAKAEVTEKVSSIGRGAIAIAAGAVFGVFAIIFGMSTLAWGLDAILVNGAGNLFLGFLIVFGVLMVLALLAFLFAWRKLKVGAPIPSMAIDEAKKVQATVTTQGTSRPGSGA
ncbi:MAG TPA: phage holin family protein [Solirubrobacteraceae bacterium]|nr:phage holin family protein [Solirubrobacteraceae bacterium]